MIHTPKQNWTAQQVSFSQKWNYLREQNAPDKTSFVPRASWPEENTEVLQEVEKAQKEYYEYLNRIYFLDKQEIILELGADTRNSWSTSIDPNRHLILRTTWSLREEHPDIWQIHSKSCYPFWSMQKTKPSIHTSQPLSWKTHLTV